MEQMNNEQAGESVSIGTQKIILEKFCKENGFSIRFGRDYIQTGYYTEVYCPLYKSIEFSDDFVA